MDNVGTQVTNVNSQVVAQQVNQPAQVAQVVDNPQPVVYTQPVQNAQAVFTQEQLNSIISGRINPLNQKISDLNTQLAQAQQLSASYLNELNGFKNKESARNAGIPDKFLDFAVFEASKLAVNGKSFEDAIKEYASANATLFGVSNQVAQTQQASSPASQQVTQGNANPAQSVPAQQNSNVVPTQPTTNQAVQFGSTNVANAGNPASSSNSNVDNEVDAFLKARGLRK